MDIPRRSFLRGALVVSAASVLPSISAFADDIPVLRGDGIHNDAPALNALFAGKPFKCENGVYAVNEGGVVHLSGGTFFIRETIRLGEFGGTISNSSFIRSDDFRGHYALTSGHMRGAVLLRNYSEQVA